MSSRNWRLISIVALVWLFAAGVGLGYLVPNYQGVVADLASIETALSDAQSNLESMQGQLTDTQTELAGVTTDLLATEDDLASKESELSSISAELEVLQGKCPPRRFSTNLELESWLSGQPNPPSSADAVLWLRHALDLQQAAADDGFLISADQWSDDGVYYLVWCSAVLEDGSYYWWDPDTDDVYYALDVNHF